ncbi:MAG: hypothetical protein KF744_04010 [Taibaiella sp.]|nr:hypothetical protein [Taibaiella sp.]
MIRHLDDRRGLLSICKQLYQDKTARTVSRPNCTYLHHHHFVCPPGTTTADGSFRPDKSLPAVAEGTDY